MSVTHVVNSFLCPASGRDLYIQRQLQGHLLMRGNHCFITSLLYESRGGTEVGAS
jgi:hypothetical protein